MLKSVRIGVILVAVAVGASACATSQQWSEWDKHSSHFASGDHLWFSLHNRSGEAPRVTRRDVQLASAQSWWGEPVVVRPDQIFEN
jgi:hypothetical protein